MFFPLIEWRKPKLTTFLGLYHGKTVGEAELVTVTAEPAIVATAAWLILNQMPQPNGNSVTTVLRQKQRDVLRAIAGNLAQTDGETSEGEEP